MMVDKDQDRKCPPAASLYFGKVMHVRMKQAAHRFTYNIFSLVIDIDRLHEAGSASRLFSFARPNLVSFYQSDHGNRDGSSLRTFVDQLLSAHDLPAPERIVLWCNPRILGYTFNPLSIYFCYDQHGDVSALIYQVHNTFGQSHCYVAPVIGGNDRHGSICQRAEKRFYVSPFLDMDLEYHFRIAPPDDRLKIRILETDRHGPVLAATFSGRRRPLTARNLLLGIITSGGLTWKIVAGIHFEALFLWLKGVSIRPRPAAPEPYSTGTQARRFEQRAE